MLICDPAGDSTTDFRVVLEELVQFIDYVERKASQENGLIERFVSQVLSQAPPQAQRHSQAFLRGVV